MAIFVFVRSSSLRYVSVCIFPAMAIRQAGEEIRYFSLSSARIEKYPILNKEQRFFLFRYWRL